MADLEIRNLDDFVARAFRRAQKRRRFAQTLVAASALQRY